jgi:hypothetical protein
MRLHYPLLDACLDLLTPRGVVLTNKSKVRALGWDIHVPSAQRPNLQRPITTDVVGITRPVPFTPVLLGGRWR